ncbi:MAG: hypothetical protein OEQ94_10490 [Nitrosopumilus sp.]|nr:hypothetical protein [Nitrosopumilus sp.]MDH3834464.1 hypothetical protein [Nitrosopumilus sp.]
MNFYIILVIIIISSFGTTANFVSAEVDLNDIEFLETGILDTSKNQFHISNEITIREFFNGNIIRVSGQTIEGFPYITYSKILDNKINTHGMIFINGQFVNLSFEEKQNQKEIDTEKKEDIVILVQYTQRVYSENFAKLEIKIFDSQQNKLNNFYQNYGYVLNADIEIIVMGEDNQEFYSSSGVTNSKGYYETEFWLPENSKRETLTVTINADNENSKSSKILQIFNLGRVPSDSGP